MRQAFADFAAVWLNTPFDAQQQSATLQRMLDFLHSSSEVFERSHAVGHFTGSAVVVSPDFHKVALTLHKKLGRWLQFGGHADGVPELDKVALQEGLEESGLPQLDFVAYEAALGHPQLRRVPFDIDIHEIPAWKDVPPHLHYDVTYLLWAPGEQQWETSHESDAVSWFTLQQARDLCSEAKMLRQFAKVEWLRPLLAYPD